MDNKKKILIGVAVAIILVVFLYFYFKSSAEKKKVAANEPPPCKKISPQEFEQKKQDWYWQGRNYGSDKLAEINNKYKKPGDDTFDGIWRWANAQVIADGFCEIIV